MLEPLIARNELKAGGGERVKQFPHPRVVRTAPHRGRHFLIGDSRRHERSAP